MGLGVPALVAAQGPAAPRTDVAAVYFPRAKVHINNHGANPGTARLPGKIQAALKTSHTEACVNHRYIGECAIFRNSLHLIGTADYSYTF